MELKELLCALEERLVQHDNNRKEIQGQLQEIYSIITEEANSLEEKLSEELQGSFNSTEENILSLIEKLNNNEEKEESNEDILIIQIQEELSNIVKYDIHQKEYTDNFINLYKLRITKSKTVFIIEDRNDTENITNQLREHLNKIHNSVISAQNKLTEICTKRRSEAEELKKRINNELETLFTEEDSRIQEVMSTLKEKNSDDNDEYVIEKLKTKAKMTLLFNQKYSLNKNYKNYSLISAKEASLKWINFEERKPSNIIISLTNNNELSISFTFFNDNEIKLLKTTKLFPFKTIFKMWEKSKNEEEEGDTKTISKDYIIGNQQICFVNPFNSNTNYYLKMKIEYQGLSSSKWSDIFEFTIPEFKFSDCVWKKCPNFVDKKRKYFIDKKNSRIATKSGWDYHSCTIIGNILLPPNKVTSWNIKILKSKNDDGWCIYVGVAPFDINQNDDDNYKECGWYFNCGSSTLYSGPPHKYNDKLYGSWKGYGKHAHPGDSVGVVMDTTKGDLSFILQEVNLGVAYEGIPLDKPLVPCVFLEHNGDSVELDLSGMKENFYADILDKFCIIL